MEVAWHMSGWERQTFPTSDGVLARLVMVKCITLCDKHFIMHFMHYYIIYDIPYLSVLHQNISHRIRFKLRTVYDLEPTLHSDLWSSSRWTGLNWLPVKTHIELVALVCWFICVSAFNLKCIVSILDTYTSRRVRILHFAKRYWFSKTRYWLFIYSSREKIRGSFSLAFKSLTTRWQCSNWSNSSHRD